MENPISPEAERQLNRFYRQYLQLHQELDYPDEKFLRQAAFQEALYTLLFEESALAHPPPHRYQLRVLKELVKRIENSIQDWEEEGISDNLMTPLSVLLSSPLPSEVAAAQQKSYVTYTLSSLQDSPNPETSNTTQSTTSSTKPAPASTPTITLLESHSLLSASGTTGLRTWEASLHLGQYLLSHPSLITHSNILELGAGTGYLSIFCSRFLSASHVLCTDGSSEVVSSLSDNFFLNGLQDDRRIQVRELRWGQFLEPGEEEKWNGGREIDVVLGADITYDEAAILALVATFGDLFEMFPLVKVLIAATVRNEVTFGTFKKTCESRGFGVKEVEFPVLGGREQEGPFYPDGVEIKICCITKGS